MKKQLFFCIIIAIMLISGCSSSKNTNTEAEGSAVTGSEISASPSNSEKVPSKADETSPERMLRKISNFVISDIWNVGFVDVSSYANSGTSSTGQSLDIDFTIEQLGKAMNKKVEYDTYMNELDTKYDSIKQIWTKLSGEIDNLYKQIQDTPPKANDENFKFDTGILNQYMDAFGDEVDDLTKP